MATRTGKMHGYFSLPLLCFCLPVFYSFIACNVSYLEKFGEFDAQQGNYEEAIKDYTKAIRYAPKDPVPHAARGYVYQKMGKNDEAIADYTQAIAT